MIPDIVAYIAVGIMGVLGLLMVTVPRICTRADDRDNPEAVKKIRRSGFLVLAAAAGATFLLLKYSR